MTGKKYCTIFRCTFLFCLKEIKYLGVVCIIALYTIFLPSKLTKLLGNFSRFLFIENQQNCSNI